MEFSSKVEYILLDKAAGLESREELIGFITSIGKKLQSESEITKDTIVGIFIDHQVFQLVKFSKGKLGYKRFKKYLSEAVKEDEKAHTKTKRMRGQLFIVTDPSKLKDSWLVKFVP